LTDGKLYYNESGECFKVFDVKDGLGIKLIQKHLEVAIVSGNSSKIIHVRAKSLEINHCYTSITEKRNLIKSIQTKLNVDSTETMFVGDDLNDLTVLPDVELFVVPADAHPLVKARSNLVLSSSGGNGAVREVVDLILREKGFLNEFLDGIQIRNE